MKEPPKNDLTFILYNKKGNVIGESEIFKEKFEDHFEIVRILIEKQNSHNSGGI